MAIRTDTFDLGALRLTSGEGRHLALSVTLDPFELGGHSYLVTAPAAVEAAPEVTDPSAASAPVQDAEEPPGDPAIPVTLDVSRMTGQGYALHLRFAATLHGPCMRCLEPAHPRFQIDAREVSQPGEGEDLESPYVIESILDVAAWARDALVLALPPALLCRPDCLGLCPVCGANLNDAGPEHSHAAAPDPRWAALSELTFEGEETAEQGASAEPSGPPARVDAD